MEQFGQYSLIRCIAVGGMGELFLAQRAGIAGFSKQVVVKRIRDPFATNPEFVDMFLNEGRVAALLDHPNIVHIYELGEVDGKYFLAMEYVPGKNLANVVEKLEGPLPLPLGLYIVAQMCEGLSFAHSATGPDKKPLKLVHRDVSPPNVLISYSGAVKLADFGIAKIVQSHQTAAGVLKGKLAYLSPEQARGEKLDRRSDIFALGLVLFEATTGQRAVPGDVDTEILYAVAHGQLRKPAAYNPDYPKDLERIFLKATARNPEQRYQTTKELHEDLLEFQMRHRMIISAARMGAFMQATFREDARAAGEAIYDTMEAKAAEAADLAAPDYVDVDPSLDETVSMSSLNMQPPDRVGQPTGPRTPGFGRAPFKSSPDAVTVEQNAPDVTAEAVAGASTGLEVKRAMKQVRRLARSRPDIRQPITGAGTTPSSAVGQSHPDFRTTEPRPAYPDPRRDQSQSQAQVRSQMQSQMGRQMTIASPSAERALADLAPSGRQSSRIAVILIAALFTLLTGFGVYVYFGPTKDSPEWLRTLRWKLGRTVDTAERGHRPDPSTLKHLDLRSVALDAAAAPLDAARPDRSTAVDSHTSPASPVDAARLPDDLYVQPSTSTKLKIISTPRLVAFVNGRRVGTTPTSTTLSPGRYTVRLTSLRQRITVTRHVTVGAAQKTLRVAVKKGQLVVRVRPWAHVFVDGVRRGTTPMRPLRLYEGRHTVRLVTESHPAPFTKTIKIVGNRTTTLVHRFRN